jgi:Ion channel
MLSSLSLSSSSKHIRAAISNDADATGDVEAPPPSSPLPHHREISHHVKISPPVETQPIPKPPLFDGGASSSLSPNHRQDAATSSPKRNMNKFPLGTNLSPEDLDFLFDLDRDYSDAAWESYLSIQAQAIWARRSAFASILIVLVVIVVGVVFFASQADWGFSNTVLFTVYTITGAGYGHVDTPDTLIYHVFDTFYMLVGIACMAICIAQVFQFFSIQAAKASLSADKEEVRAHGLHELAKNQQAASSKGLETVAVALSQGKSVIDTVSVTNDDDYQHAKAVLEHHHQSKPHRFWFVSCMGTMSRQFKRLFFTAWYQVRTFFQTTMVGRILSVVLPLLLILSIGAILIGQLEGWSFSEGFYFAVASMTTTGYGDFYPVTTAGIWVSIFWLPLSPVFMSIYMASIASLYFAVARQTIPKIEQSLRRKQGSEAQLLDSKSDCNGRSSQQPGSPPASGIPPTHQYSVGNQLR